MSRSPRRRDLSLIRFREEIVGDHPGRVYIDLKVTAHAPSAHLEDEQIGYALALYDKSAQNLTLADVNIDVAWRNKGLCTKLVERLFRLAGDRYQPRNFFIDVRPQKGSDTGVRACACYLKAIHRAWEGNVTQLRIEYESGEAVVLNDTRAEAALCRRGNLQIEGQLMWETT